MLTSTWQDLIGTSIAERYTLRDLVEGGHSQAEFSATSPGGKEPVSVALVEVEPAEIESELAAIERARQLQHPNILRIVDGGECAIDGTRMLFIVTEAEQGTLAASTAPDLRGMLEDLLPPLEWLHAQGLVYRNLEPETVVRGIDGRWKLADLSRVHAVGRLDAGESAGHNAPPEASEGKILPAWDMWNLGILLRDLRGGEGKARLAPFDAIVTGCLESDPSRRLSPADIRKMLVPDAPKLLPEAPKVEVEAPVAAPHVSDARASWRWVVPTLAVLAVLGGVLFVLLRPHDVAVPPQPAPRAAAVPAPVQSATPPVVPEVKKSPFPGALVAGDAARTVAATPDEQVGRADYFSDDLEGHPTASGEPFSNNELTAASRQFRMGTHLLVTDLQNKRSVTVRVNDRGPTRSGFIITVTRRAAEQLGFVKAGSARVRVERVK